MTLETHVHLDEEGLWRWRVFYVEKELSPVLESVWRYRVRASAEVAAKRFMTECRDKALREGA